MSEQDGDDLRHSGDNAGRAGWASIHPFPLRGAPVSVVRLTPNVSFDRSELRELMQTYGRGVAEGVWKDYALDFSSEKAVLSIYKRASEVPLYRVEKDPALARKQGAYAVINAAGLVLKRGQELARVLRVIEPKPKLTVV